MALSQGDRLGRYEVLGPIGSGGMGEVWQARDTELDRQVAVKVLPESFATDENRLERFQREAKALAALSHPNLLDIYDVGSSNGLHYAVTELLEGDTLRERITPTGLPWQKVTEIGGAVADGLAAAHGRGIIHRDIKPENLFITADGRVKILDFGLASVHEEAEPDAETATITEAGTVMGTPGYMSPEQVKGKQADARSDIFSLGCVIYEMASGHRAFGGETGVEVIANILKEEPPQLSSSGASVPVDLERAVHRCLEKRPEARFQSAADLAYSLKGVGHSGAAPAMATPQPSTVTDVTMRPRPHWQLPAAVLFVVIAIITSWWALTRGDDGQEVATPRSEIALNRIAVVPFENLTGDNSLASIGTLAANRISQGLAGIESDREVKEVDIVPSARIRELLASGTSPTATSISGATGARIVVTGSYIRRGEQLEFDGAITDSSSNEVVHVFEPVATPEGDPTPALATLRDHAFIVVTDHLSSNLGLLADERFPKIEAYKVLLNALRNYYAGDFGQALALGPKALEIDPDFNRARLWLLMSSANKPMADSLFDELDMRRDQLTARQLLFMEMKRAQYASDWETAYKAVRSLTDIAPGYGFLYRNFAMFLALNSNRPGAVLEFWERVKAIEGEEVARGSLAAADALHLLARYNEELAVGEYAVAQNPNGFWERVRVARALVGLGRIDEVEQLVDDTLQVYQSEEMAGGFMLQVARTLRAHGHLDEGRAMADRAAEWFGRRLETEQDAYLREGFLSALLIGDHFEELVAEIDGLQDPSNSAEFFGIVCLGIGAAHTGDRTLANAVAAHLEATGDFPGAEHRGWATYMRACIAAHLGDREEALRLVRRALAEGFRYGIFHHNNPFNEPLRDDPEFQEIMRPKG